MRSFVFIGTILVALTLSFILVGFCSPVEQSSELSMEFECSKDALWNKVTTIDLLPSIKADVHEVEVIEEDQNKKWVEYSKIGAKKIMEVEEEVYGERLIVKEYDPSLNIEKRRVYSFFGSDDKSVLSIKEFVRVEKILLRSTMAISGQKHGIKKELDDLAKHMQL